MRITRISSLALLCSTFTALAGPAAPLPAAPPPASDSGWSFRAAPYLWALGLEGTLGVKGLEVGVDVPFSDIFNDLDIAFMGAFEARNGPWGITLDMQYSKLSDSAYPHGSLLTSASFDMEQFMGNLALSYRVMENEGTVVDLYGGVRMNWLDASVSVTGVNGGIASQSGDESWADGIVGLRFQTALGGDWSFRAVGDIGAGDSDLTWQGMGILVYRLSESWNLGLGYRAIGVDYQDGGFTYDVTSHGPILGAEYRF
jgi:opacity protein-like surface antigen